MKNKLKSKNKYKVLITTSGLGSRLGDITKFTNKSLVRVGKKPAISYIIESYPREIEIVVTTGYFADQVKEFITLAYPERKITFVDVDNYQGQGSSLGYSMLQAKEHLQCSFIFHCCDTIVNNAIPAPDHNWCAGFKGENGSDYSSFTAIDGKINNINDKGANNFDYLHIGLVGIKDFKEFWHVIENEIEQNPNDSSINDCRAINKMVKSGKNFTVKEFNDWFDIGNIDGLNLARKQIADSLANLDKLEESIFLFDDFVIKFFNDQKMAEQRVSRGKFLGKLVPEIIGAGKNFYKYKFVEGELYSRVITPADSRIFLEWAETHLWKKMKEVDNNRFKRICQDFYETKTKERAAKFLAKYSIKDEENVINGEKIPSLEQILKKVDFAKISDSEQYQFHGDFILDNILKTKDGYCLLDWRQNFGGLLKAGDMYYDLAKLNHNLTVNHDMIYSNLFTIEIEGKKIECDILRKENLVACQQVYHQFLLKNKYDLKKVKVLTAIIWLNMSPLHHHPFDLFLYYFGKLNLWRSLQEK